jgi:hypothetical protein
MFSKYVDRLKEGEDGSPSVSKFVLENQFSHPSRLVDSLEVTNVPAHGGPNGVVHAEDTSDTRDSGKMVNVPATTQITPKRGEKHNKDKLSATCAVPKRTVSPNPGTSAPSLLTSIPAKVDTEPPSRTTRIGRKSQPPELLSRRGMSTSEKSANPKPAGIEVKAGIVHVSKGSGSSHRRASAPSLARSIPCKVHPKPPSESPKLDTESQAPELSRQRPFQLPRTMSSTRWRQSKSRKGTYIDCHKPGANNG